MAYTWHGVTMKNESKFGYTKPNPRYILSDGTEIINMMASKLGPIGLAFHSIGTAMMYLSRNDREILRTTPIGLDSDNMKSAVWWIMIAAHCLNPKAMDPRSGRKAFTALFREDVHAQFVQNAPGPLVMQMQMCIAELQADIDRRRKVS